MKMLACIVGASFSFTLFLFCIGDGMACIHEYIRGRHERNNDDVGDKLTTCAAKDLIGATVCLSLCIISCLGFLGKLFRT